MADSQRPKRCAFLVIPPPPKKKKKKNPGFSTKLTGILILFIMLDVSVSIMYFEFPD